MADFGLWMSPQNPHKSASAAGGPHKNPTYMVMTLKFLLSFPRLKPSLPESPGGPQEGVPAGHG